MNGNLKLVMVAIMLGAAGVVLAQATAAPEPTLEAISHYRQWRRVTPQVMKIDFASVAG